MENLIFQLVLERPVEPTAFMVDWIQRTARHNLNGLNQKKRKIWQILDETLGNIEQRKRII